MKDKPKPKFRIGQRVMYTSPVGRKYDRLITISRIEWYDDIRGSYWMYFAFFEGPDRRESYATDQYLEAISCPMK